MMNRSSTKLFAIGALAIAMAAAAAAVAENVFVKAIMAPKQTMKINFHDGSKHSVVMVRREGKSEGCGSLSGAAVTEYGWHDINPPAGADSHGYLQFKVPTGI